jgi:hypothetical protein
MPQEYTSRSPDGMPIAWQDAWRWHGNWNATFQKKNLIQNWGLNVLF